MEKNNSANQKTEDNKPVKKKRFNRSNSNFTKKYGFCTYY